MIFKAPDHSQFSSHILSTCFFHSFTPSFSESGLLFLHSNLIKSQALFKVLLKGHVLSTFFLMFHLHVYLLLVQTCSALLVLPQFPECGLQKPVARRMSHTDRDLRLKHVVQKLFPLWYFWLHQGEDLMLLTLCLSHLLAPFQFLFSNKGRGQSSPQASSLWQWL